MNWANFFKSFCLSVSYLVLGVVFLSSFSTAGLGGQILWLLAFPAACIYMVVVVEIVFVMLRPPSVQELANLLAEKKK